MGPQIMVPKLPMRLMQAPGGAGSFSPLSFPLCWALKHGLWKMIMWPPFICKKRQPTKHCCRQLGWFWRGDAMGVECVRRMLMHHFDHQVKPQKIKNENYTSWHCGQKTSKNTRQPTKTVQVTGEGHFKRDAIGAKHFVGHSLVIWDGKLSDTKKKEKKILRGGRLVVDSCQTIERHRTTNQKGRTH